MKIDIRVCLDFQHHLKLELELDFQFGSKYRSLNNISNIDLFLLLLKVHFLRRQKLQWVTSEVYFCEDL